MEMECSEDTEAGLVLARGSGTSGGVGTQLHSFSILRRGLSGATGEGRLGPTLEGRPAPPLSIGTVQPEPLGTDCHALPQQRILTPCLCPRTLAPQGPLGLLSHPSLHPCQERGWGKWAGQCPSDRYSE